MSADVEKERKILFFFLKKLIAKFLPAFMKTRTYSENLYRKIETLSNEFLRHTKSADERKKII
jgi:hypothetical protein